MAKTTSRFWNITADRLASSKTPPETTRLCKGGHSRFAHWVHSWPSGETLMTIRGSGLKGVANTKRRSWKTIVAIGWSLKPSAGISDHPFHPVLLNQPEQILEFELSTMNA